MVAMPEITGTPAQHRRRPRYAGKYPRKFEEKYKEHAPAKYSDTVAKVLASGKTPAGTHRPIMPDEILETLAPAPGQIGVDCTLGYGGHAERLLRRIQPGGRLLGLDADPVEITKTEQRLRELGFGPETFTTQRTNFAGLSQALAVAGLSAVDFLLADLGVSSMQLDDPSRGFSMKFDGPLDMRMNPQRSQTASEFLRKVKPDALAELLIENADEPHAATLGPALAQKLFRTTAELARAVRTALPRGNAEARELSVRRVFQAVRIAVNDEFSALESLLRQLPACLKPGGRAVILTFHSGEDRRVKKAFAMGLKSGVYHDISHDVLRPSATERNENPRSSPAKLRWARRAD
jgi:16S rRNA (cytosine1402-N4)-methyltransferase